MASAQERMEFHRERVQQTNAYYGALSRASEKLDNLESCCREHFTGVRDPTKFLGRPRASAVCSVRPH